MTILFRAFAALCVSAILVPAAAQARLQCVPFARQVSGIEIRGNAETWWGQAAGKYERGQKPAEGSVLAMPGTRRNPMGHVAMVSKIVSDREVLLTHANWSRPGMIERDVKAIDVSEKGDWSAVRVWHAGSGQIGVTTYPAQGFIYPKKLRDVLEPQVRYAFVLSDDVRQLAASGG